MESERTNQTQDQARRAAQEWMASHRANQTQDQREEDMRAAQEDRNSQKK